MGFSCRILKKARIYRVRRRMRVPNCINCLHFAAGIAKKKDTCRKCLNPFSFSNCSALWKLSVLKFVLPLDRSFEPIYWPFWVLVIGWQFRTKCCTHSWMREWRRIVDLFICRFAFPASQAQYFRMELAWMIGVFGSLMHSIRSIWDYLFKLIFMVLIMPPSFDV